MKLSMLFWVIITMVLLLSCKKTDLSIPQDQTPTTGFQNAQVIKNCLGSFLQIENKNYLVCNENLVQNYPHESQVQVRLNRQTGCNYSGTCYMYVEYEYSVEILGIQ